MDACKANFTNAAALVTLGLWGYFSSGSAPATALIPVGFGLIFATATPLLKKGHAIAGYILILLTSLLVIALLMPLLRSIRQSNTGAVFRVTLMIALSLHALFYLVKESWPGRGKSRQ